MSTHSKIPSGLGARRDKTYQEDEHDTYKLQGKLKEPTVCPTCGAVFRMLVKSGSTCSRTTVTWAMSISSRRS